jgi:xylulokinase
MNALAAGSPPGARGLLYLPYLLGERSPRWNAEARGAFIGLTMRHTRADLFRAALEGITLNLRVILDAFRAQGANIDSMRLIGGGAQGRFWNQLMADIYGIPTHRMTMLEEATSMGAAVAGGVGVGLYPGFAISEQMNAIAETVQPQPAEAERYAAVYDAFERAYTHVEPLFGELAAIDRAGEVRA